MQFFILRFGVQGTMRDRLMEDRSIIAWVMCDQFIKDQLMRHQLIRERLSKDPNLARFPTKPLKRLSDVACSVTGGSVVPYYP